MKAESNHKWITLVVPILILLITHRKGPALTQR